MTDGRETVHLRSELANLPNQEVGLLAMVIFQGSETFLAGGLGILDIPLDLDPAVACVMFREAHASITPFVDLASRCIGPQGPTSRRSTRPNGERAANTAILQRIGQRPRLSLASFIDRP